MDSRRELAGWVLLVAGLTGLGSTWLLSGLVAAGVGVTTVLLLSVGVVLVGTAVDHQEPASG